VPARDVADSDNRKQGVAGLGEMQLELGLIIVDIENGCDPGEEKTCPSAQKAQNNITSIERERTRKD
jgi:hypothetical protein